MNKHECITENLNYFDNKNLMKYNNEENKIMNEPITQDEFDEILKKHELWLKGEKDGECANFENANLREIDLSGKRIRCVDFSGAYLAGADIRYAKFEKCNFCCASFTFADLTYACFYDTEIRGATFLFADLTCTDFRGSDIRNSDLCNAFIERTNFEKTNIEGLRYGLCKEIDADFDENQIKKIVNGIICSALCSRSTSLDFRDKLKQVIKILNSESSD